MTTFPSHTCHFIFLCIKSEFHIYVKHWNFSIRLDLWRYLYIPTGWYSVHVVITHYLQTFVQGKVALCRMMVAVYSDKGYDLNWYCTRKVWYALVSSIRSTHQVIHYLYSLFWHLAINSILALDSAFFLLSSGIHSQLLLHLSWYVEVSSLTLNEVQCKWYHSLVNLVSSPTLQSLICISVPA